MCLCKTIISIKGQINEYGNTNITFISIVYIFEKAEQRFYELTNTLQARHTLAVKFSDIEKLIENEGRELLRLLLQAHIDSQGVGDVGQSVDATDGVIRTHKRIGELQRRVAWEVIGRWHEMNWPDVFYLSHQRLIKDSFDDAVKSITESTGQLIHKQQIQHIAVSVINES